MSDCCSSAPGFPSASQMEQLALDHPTIWREICAIQQAILSAASNCQPDGGRMCTVVGGETPMTFVTGVRSIDVLDPGAGYLQDHPTLELIPPVGATVTPASATVTTNGGTVVGITITNAGMGYGPVGATLDVGSANGVGAILRPFVNASGEIIGVNIEDGGLGYAINDGVYASRAVEPNAAYIDARLRVSSVSSAGRILAVDIIEPGTGYQPSITTARLVSSLTNGLPYPYGMGFEAAVYTDAQGGISQITVVNGGTGYVDLAPRLVVSDIGTGLTTRVNMQNDGIATIDVLTRGTNYTASATAMVLNPVTTTVLPARDAVVRLNVAVNTFGTDPQRYYNVWSGAASDKQIQLQMSTVTSYFTRLGYTITVQSNPSTGKTIQWKICW